MRYRTNLFLMILVIILLALNVSSATAEDLRGFDDDAVLAYRWHALAQYYEAHSLLNSDAAFFVEAEECLCARWIAMADYYERHGLLMR